MTTATRFPLIIVSNLKDASPQNQIICCFRLDSSERSHSTELIFYQMPEQTLSVGIDSGFKICASLSMTEDPAKTSKNRAWNSIEAALVYRNHLAVTPRISEYTTLATIQSLRETP
jgi:hypothetical protein